MGEERTKKSVLCPKVCEGRVHYLQPKMAEFKIHILFLGLGFFLFLSLNGLLPSLGGRSALL